MTFIKQSISLVCLLTPLSLFATTLGENVVKYDKENGIVYYADGTIYQVPVQEAPTPLTVPQVQSTTEIISEEQSVHKTETLPKVSPAPLKKVKKSKSGITGSAKLIHIVNGKDNGYDANTGSAYYLDLGYQTPEVNGLSAKISGYVVGDTGLTDKDETVGKAIFLGENTGDNDDVTETQVNLGETYLKYRNNTFKAQVGHYELNTPMTKNATSTVPNLYEGVLVSSDKIIDDTIVVGTHISRMAYGARSLADWGLIGEKTGTAGAIKVYSNDTAQFTTTADDAAMPNVRRGEYTNMGKISGAGENTAGVTAVGVINTSLKNTTIQAWEYYAFDVANITYIDGMAKIKLQNGINTMVGAQIMHQNVDNQDGNPMLFGVKGAVGYKGAKLILAVNKSNGDVILNAWGGDPAYTSSIFSKNAYRPDVDAYKVIGQYNIPALKDGFPKNMTLMVSYANYGRSSLANTQQDATETDIVLKYKPQKNLLLMLFNAQRESEFNGLNDKDKTQDQTRFVMKYQF